MIYTFYHLINNKYKLTHKKFIPLPSVVAWRGTRGREAVGTAGARRTARARRVHGGGTAGAWRGAAGARLGCTAGARLGCTAWVLGLRRRGEGVRGVGRACAAWAGRGHGLRRRGRGCGSAARACAAWAWARVRRGRAWGKAAWRWRRGGGSQWWLPAERVGKTVAVAGRWRWRSAWWPGGGGGRARGEDDTAMAALEEDGGGGARGRRCESERRRREGEEEGLPGYIFNVFTECPRSGTRQRFF
jgi:hypothetical protein